MISPTLLSDEGYMVSVIKKVLYSPYLPERIFHPIEEAFKQQPMESQMAHACIDVLITKSLRPTDLYEFLTDAVMWELRITTNRGTFSSHIRDKLRSRQMDYHIMYEINRVIKARLRDSIVVIMIQKLLSSNQLDDIIMDAARQMQQSRDHRDHDDIMMDTISSMSSALKSRQLDGSLMDTFEEQAQSGRFDNALMISFTEMLHSGSLDELLMRVIMELHSQVGSQHI